MLTNAGKVLVVDDDTDILEILGYNLSKAGYETELVSNGREAVAKALHFLPDLILLDVMMPEKDGYETIKLIRQKKALEDTSIIFLTALSDELSEITGLQLGADDYISKPIKMDLLLARIKTALRRSNKKTEEEGKIIHDDFEIDKDRFLVTYKAEDFVLAKKEFELLCLLASKPGKVFLRTEILDAVWGDDVIVGDRTIDVHVRKIRQKLGAKMITTVKGVGYKFSLSES